MSPHDLFSLLKQTYTEWSEDKAPRLAAALAFYTAFSLAPVLLIAIAIAGFFYADADEDARRQIAAIIPGGGDAITGLLDAANRSGRTGFAAIVGVVTLLFGASGFFGQLQDAMNTIWDVAPRPGQGFMATVRQRFLSFTMVLGTGFLLLVSLLVSVVLSTAMGYLGNLVPGVDALWGLVSYAMSLVMSTLIFAMIFKVVPDVEIAWRDVWLGAAVTAVLFMIGQALLNLYLASQETAYGVFGSLIVLLLWVFYSTQILFFGAEFAQVYATRRGSRPRPAANAVALTDDARARQGMPTEGQVAAAVEADPEHESPAGIPASSRPLQRHPAKPESGLPVMAGIAGLVIGLALGVVGRKGSGPDAPRAERTNGKHRRNGRPS